MNLTAKAILLALLALSSGCGTKAKDNSKANSLNGAAQEREATPKEKRQARVSALYNAIEAGDTIIVRQNVSDESLDLNLHFSNGESPLTFALKKGKPSVVQAILEKAADPDFSNAGGQIPLHIAIEKQDRSGVYFLLRAGANVNLADAQGKSALIKALEFEDEMTALELLKEGSNLSRDAREALNLARRHSMADARKLMRDILRSGADAGIERIKQAVLDLDIHYLDYLWRQSDIRAKASGARLLETVLDIENPRKRVWMLKRFLNRGFNPDGEKGDGRSPLFKTAKKNLSLAAQALLSYGADPNVINEENLTPLAVAAQNLNVLAAKQLLGYQAKTSYELEKNGEKIVVDVCSRLPRDGWLWWNRLNDQEEFRRDRLRWLLKCR